MVAVRLCQNNLIDNGTLERLIDDYTQEWEKEQEKRKAKHGGGPSFYKVRRSQLGRGTLQFARRMIQSRSLAVSKAAVILSVKPWQVPRLLKSAT